MSNTNKVSLVIPREGDFEPSAIPFGCVTGEGVPNYDEDGFEYSASIILSKKAKKDVLETVMNHWEKNKPEGAGDEPDNFDNIVRETEDGENILYSKTQTHFGSKENKVTIVNHLQEKLDPEEFGNIGAGSEGRLAVKMGIYTQGKGSKMKAGISMYLSAVKLTKFVPYEGSDGASAFGEGDSGDVDSKHGFKSETKAEKKPKKNKKKKKKK